jgi:ribonuclease G
MATELIINATLPETRIALLENGEIQELHIERDSERGIVGNIYKGKVIRVLPGMQAAFVDIGLEKAAFLYVDDIFFPDMNTPLVSPPLPSDAPKPVSVTPNVVPNANAVAAPSTGSGRGRFQRGRDGRGGQKAVQGPVAPGSPEDHARLQREYALQMLNGDDEGADENAPKTEQLEGQPEQAPVVAAPATPGLGAEIDPREGQIEGQVEARSPVSDEEDDAEGSEAQVVYRPEPLIDASAWAEDVADADDAEPAAEVTSAAGAETSAASETAVAQEGTLTESQTEPAAVEIASLEAEGSQAGAETKSVEPGAPIVKPVQRGATFESSDDDDGDEDEDATEMPRRRRRREPVNIADIIKEGQEIIVQVAKDPIGTKGARLTCHVSLPGRYLVFMPTVDHIGVSRRIEGEGERRRLKETISKIRPAGTGVIVRTASGKQTDKKLKADLDYLVTTWNDIQKKFKKQRTPSPVYQDMTIVLRAIRDMFTDEVDKVVVDSKREHKAIMKFVQRFIPNVKEKVELFEGDMPIFDYFGIETEISRAMERKVWLKSGGYLVIDQAEALVAIDVNTGRYVGKKTLEETILKTNLEAVKEIAYQLRLRNCGGIIILDLIDMEKENNRDKVYKALEEAIKKDRARPSIMKISQLGLVEMTRKRTRDSLVRSLCEPCSYCEGKSFVKNKLTIAYDIMRDIEREASVRETLAVSIQCHPTVADVLLEDKRDVIEDMERQFSKKVTIRGNGAYHVEQYELIAHGEGKNIVWSSEERRQRVRQKSQERQQQIAAEVRKQAEVERQERRKEQEEKRRQAEAQRAERRAQAEERRRIAMEQRAAAIAARNAAIEAGADPNELPPIEGEGELAFQDAEGLEGDLAEGGELLPDGTRAPGSPRPGGKPLDPNRRRRRRGRRGRGGRGRNNDRGFRGPNPNAPGASAGGNPQSGLPQDAYESMPSSDRESFGPAELAGSTEPGAGQAGREQNPDALRRRRRRGRRGGRRRFRGPRDGQGNATSGSGGAPKGNTSSDAPAVSVSPKGDTGHDRQ